MVSQIEVWGEILPTNKVPMNKVVIQDGTVLYQGSALGPTSNIYVYPGEQLHLGCESDEVVVCMTPRRIDLVFAAGDRVVGCEVKRVDDLVNSHLTRRLHRQLRTLRETVDIACLLVRGLSDAGIEDQLYSAHTADAFWGDFVNAQTQGVYILPVPVEGYLPRLQVYRSALATSGLRALAGTDRHDGKERAAGWLLRRIPGIGLRRSSLLTKAFGDTWSVFEAAKRGEVAPILGKGVEYKICNALSQ